jgi:hypothetical protein
LKPDTLKAQLDVKMYYSNTCYQTLDKWHSQDICNSFFTHGWKKIDILLFTLYTLLFYFFWRNFTHFYKYKYTQKDWTTNLTIELHILYYYINLDVVNFFAYLSFFVVFFLRIFFVYMIIWIWYTLSSI